MDAEDRQSWMATADGASIRMQLPPELTYKGATQGGQLDRGLVVWSLGRLGPREERVVQFTAVGGRLLERSTLVATASADRSTEVRADLPLEILGTPVLKVSLQGTAETVEVGGRLIYAVELRNTGSLAVRESTCRSHFRHNSSRFSGLARPLFVSKASA